MGDIELKVVSEFVGHIVAMDVEGALACLSPDVVLEEMGSIPLSGTYHGKDGFGELLGKIGTFFGGLELTDTSVHDAGDFVVARMTGTFTSKDGTQQAKMRIVELYAVRDGLLCHMDVYYKDPDQFKSFTF